MLGRSEDDLLGVDSLSLIHEDDRRERPTWEANPEGSAGREVRLLRADGVTVRAIVSWSWLLGTDGSPYSAVATVQDVTQQRLVEHGLQRLEKLESLGVLAGGLAHDFNNIVAVILANVSYAARLPEVGSVAREVLEQAEQASHRARELAQQLITFAKGGTPIKRASSVAALLNEAASFYLRGSNVNVEVSLASDLWLSELDPAQMSQVLQNLFINAVQAMPNGGTVHVDAENVELASFSATPLAPGRYVRIRVRDEGLGIPAADLGRVFDPYFSTKSGGTGLGLATAHSIVLRHGGHLAVASAPGEGATFSLWLQATEATAPSRPPAPSPRPPLPCRRVLVMDDHAALRKTLAMILGGCGLAVDTAADGEEAIATYRTALGSPHPYAMVLLDLTVPGGMGGIETLTRLRELDPGVRAIVSTGYSTDPVMADCRAFGFAAAVPKPFNAMELEAIVREVLTEN
jgi:signal transduction histidine kinase/ActR/RegA family two-component response regulator